MSIPFDLFSDVAPSSSQEQTSFFASGDLFGDVEPDPDADLFDDIEESDTDLFDDLEQESDNDLFNDINNEPDDNLDDLYNTILDEPQDYGNPNTSVLYAVPGVDYGRPEDFPDITQIKERFLSELMSDF